MKNLKPNREYHRIHAWIKRNYGKANKCESSNCKKISTSYHWALKKGFNYEKARENFIMLCQSCHKIYDMNDLVRDKMSKSKQGEKHSRSKLTDAQVIEIRKNYSFRKNTCKKLALQYNVCEHTILYILNRRTWNHI